MKTLVVFLFLLLIVRKSANPLEECKTAPGEEERDRCEIISEESGLQDDDKTNITCPVGYSILDCILVQVAELKLRQLLRGRG